MGNVLDQNFRTKFSVSRWKNWLQHILLLLSLNWDVEKQALIFQYPGHTHTAQVINYGMKDQDVIKFEVTWISSTKLKLRDPADISELWTVNFNICVFQQGDFHYLQFQRFYPFERDNPLEIHDKRFM